MIKEQFYHLSESIWFIPILKSLSTQECYTGEKSFETIDSRSLAYHEGMETANAKYLAMLVKVRFRALQCHITSRVCHNLSGLLTSGTISQMMDGYDRVCREFPSFPLPKVPPYPVSPWPRYKTLFFSLSWGKESPTFQRHQSQGWHGQQLHGVEFSHVEVLEVRFLDFCFLAIPCTRQYLFTSDDDWLTEKGFTLVWPTAAIFAGATFCFLSWIGYACYGRLGSIWMAGVALAALFWLVVVGFCSFAPEDRELCGYKESNLRF